jgi:O-antigen ligase
MNVGVVGKHQINILSKFFLMFLVVSWFALGLIFSGFHFLEGLGVLSIASLFFYIVLMVCALSSEKNYWRISPFIVFFTPNAINDIFPSLPISIDADSPQFSFFTHIDIFLMAGVIAYCDFSKSSRLVFWGLLVSVVGIYALVLLSAISSGYGGTALVGGFQLRYLILMMLIFNFSNVTSYNKEFFQSLIFVGLAVIVEAAVFSWLRGHDRLTSGNYGTNAFGHFMAAIFVLSLQRSDFYKRFSSLFALFAFLLAIYFSATRFSLVATFMAMFIMFIVKYKRIDIFVAFVLVGAVAGFGLLGYTSTGQSVVNGVRLVFESGYDPGYISITPDSSSMVTRIILWSSTISMFLDNFWLGVGGGNWAYLKYDYGVPFDSVFDPHQDMLNYFVSYGAILGGGMFMLIYINPLVRAVRSYKLSHDQWRCFSVLLVFLICGFTNAVSWKHQLSVLIFYCSLSLYYLKSGNVDVRS